MIFNPIGNPHGAKAIDHRGRRLDSALSGCTCQYVNTADGPVCIHQRDNECPVHGDKQAKIERLERNGK